MNVKAGIYYRIDHEQIIEILFKGATVRRTQRMRSEAYLERIREKSSPIPASTFLKAVADAGERLMYDSNTVEADMAQNENE